MAHSLEPWRGLPPEVRNEIWAYALTQDEPVFFYQRHVPKSDPIIRMAAAGIAYHPLILTSRTEHTLMKSLFFRNNSFVFRCRPDLVTQWLDHLSVPSLYSIRKLGFHLTEGFWLPKMWTRMLSYMAKNMGLETLAIILDGGPKEVPEEIFEKVVDAVFASEIGEVTVTSAQTARMDIERAGLHDRPVWSEANGNDESRSRETINVDEDYLVRSGGLSLKLCEARAQLEGLTWTAYYRRFLSCDLVRPQLYPHFLLTTRSLCPFMLFTRHLSDHDGDLAYVELVLRPADPDMILAKAASVPAKTHAIRMMLEDVKQQKALVQRSRQIPI